MSEPRPFKIVVSGVAIVVMAASALTAEAHARSLATKDIVTSVSNLPEADYQTFDFKGITRIAGGKADAPVFPFVVTVGDETEVKLATSTAAATKYLEDKIQDKASYSVEPLPVAEYGTVDWTSIETLVEPEKSKRGRKPASEKAAGDADKQTEIPDTAAVEGADIPGME